MTASFYYRPRKGGSWQPAIAGTTIILGERTEYVLTFPQPLAAAQVQRFAEIGGDLIRPETAVLCFDNFVGRVEFAGVAIEVVSTKIGSGGVSRILQELSELASALIFGVRAPTSFAAQKDFAASPPVPFHQLQFLRHAMLLRPAGQRLQDAFGIIERNPTRRFDRERPLLRPEKTRRLDARAVQSIFSRLDRLVPVPVGSPFAVNPLAQALAFGDPPQAHFPAHVSAPSGRLSFDTPENRFVKHVLDECLALVYRFVDHPRIHAGLRADCRVMLGLLESMAAAAFLSESRQMGSFQAPSQALAKSDGYRDLFAFWGELSAHVSLPRSATATARLLEGRDMATLYEYWTFVKVVEAVTTIIGQRPDRIDVRQDEIGERLDYGLVVTFGNSVAVHFNPTFQRSAGTAYSTPLRPDVIVEVAESRHALDAKYRLEWFDTSESDVDEESATYKRADLYKMHAYRDAIVGLRTAFVVYPGTEFVFFRRDGTKFGDPSAVTELDGVGAVPLRPASEAPADPLQALLRVLLGQTAAAGS